MRGGRRSLRLSERRSRPGIFAFWNGRLLLLEIGVQKPDQRFLLRRVQKPDQRRDRIGLGRQLTDQIVIRRAAEHVAQRKQPLRRDHALAAFDARNVVF